MTGVRAMPDWCDCWDRVHEDEASPESWERWITSSGPESSIAMKKTWRTCETSTTPASLLGTRYLKMVGWLARRIHATGRKCVIIIVNERPIAEAYDDARNPHAVEYFRFNTNNNPETDDQFRLSKSISS
jgi:hypothetical protein